MGAFKKALKFAMIITGNNVGFGRTLIKNKFSRSLLKVITYKHIYTSKQKLFFNQLKKVKIKSLVTNFKATILNLGLFHPLGLFHLINFRYEK